MKITIVLGPQWPLPPTGFGAVEKVWVELAEVFATQGHEVCVIGRGVNGAAERLLPSGVRVRERKGFSASGSLWLDLCMDFSYALRVFLAIPRSDIVVTNSFSLPVVLTPIKRWKGRVVVHVARFPKGQMVLYRGADAVQAISGAVAGAIVQQCRALQRKVSVVGYPVNLDVYTPPRTPRRMPAAPLILYVGRVHPEKGLHLLVAAFGKVLERIPGAKLRIVGPAEAERGGGGIAYLASLQAMAEGRPVEFAAAVSDPAMLASAYRQADCFCYPSLAEKGEAFGLSVLEAMATGLPCVVSGLACFAEFMVSGVDGLAFDHSASEPHLALAEALYSILSDPPYAGTLGRNARARAEEFAIDKIASSYLALFSKLAHPPTQTAASQAN